ncbi:hypothetical protein QE152_g18037 [Popillia japonica]|uniref:Uncharacterized protein n=1 Tax=Popillia japonica TaxID=7064 RepID=A0AAW1L3E6_POPJA
MAPSLPTSFAMYQLVVTPPLPPPPPSFHPAFSVPLRRFKDITAEDILALYHILISTTLSVRILKQFHIDTSLLPEIVQIASRTMQTVTRTSHVTRQHYRIAHITTYVCYHVSVTFPICH